MHCLLLNIFTKSLKYFLKKSCIKFKQIKVEINVKHRLLFLIRVESKIKKYLNLIENFSLGIEINL